MVHFPTTTAVHRRLPKEAFYKHLPLTKVLKDKFVSEVDRIVVENSLTKENLNLTADSEVKEILLLSITLKKQEFDGKVIEAIARQNPHKLVFLLVEQIALYEERAKRADSLSVDERLAFQEQILKLEKLIAKTEMAAWKEPQPKKQFELYSRLREYKKKLEEIKR